MRSDYTDLAHPKAFASIGQAGHGISDEDLELPEQNRQISVEVVLTIVLCRLIGWHSLTHSLTHHLFLFRSKPLL